MKVCIHQPDFLPWLGFFHKIVNCDRYVVFDNVDAPLGKSWLTRNRISLRNEPSWITLPAHKSQRTVIKELSIARENSFTKKHLGTIRQAYYTCKFFDELYPVLEKIYSMNVGLVAEFNYLLVEKLLTLMKVDTDVKWATDLLPGDAKSYLKGNDMVLALAKAANATIYISGTGCTDFIEPEEFEKENIEFRFQQFEHPQYAQNNSIHHFHSHLSIIDAIFNIGSEATVGLLRAK